MAYPGGQQANAGVAPPQRRPDSAAGARPLILPTVAQSQTSGEPSTLFVKNEYGKPVSLECVCLGQTGQAISRVLLTSKAGVEQWQVVDSAATEVRIRAWLLQPALEISATRHQHSDTVRLTIEKCSNMWESNWVPWVTARLRGQGDMFQTNAAQIMGSTRNADFNHVHVMRDFVNEDFLDFEVQATDPTNKGTRLVGRCWIRSDQVPTNMSWSASLVLQPHLTQPGTDAVLQSDGPEDGEEWAVKLTAAGWIVQRTEEWRPGETSWRRASLRSHGLGDWIKGGLIDDFAIAVEEGCKAIFNVRRPSFKFCGCSVISCTEWDGTDKLYVIRARVFEDCEGVCGSYRQDWLVPLYQVGSWNPQYVVLPQVDPKRPVSVWAAMLGAESPPAEIVAHDSWREQHQRNGIADEVCIAQHIQTAADVKSAFRRADADGNGWMSRDELARLLHELNPDFTAHLGTLFKAANIGQDGVLNYEEFLSWIYKPVPAASHETIYEGLQCTCLCINEARTHLYYAGDGLEVGTLDLATKEVQVLEYLESEATGLALHHQHLYVLTKSTGSANGRLLKIAPAVDEMEVICDDLEDPRALAVTQEGTLFFLETAQDGSGSFVCKLLENSDPLLPPPRERILSVPEDLVIGKTVAGRGRSLLVLDRSGRFFVVGCEGKGGEADTNGSIIILCAEEYGNPVIAAAALSSNRGLILDSGGRLHACGVSSGRLPGLLCFPGFMTADDFGRGQCVCLDDDTSSGQQKQLQRWQDVACFVAGASGVLYYVTVGGLVRSARRKTQEQDDARDFLPIRRAMSLSRLSPSRFDNIC